MRNEPFTRLSGEDDPGRLAQLIDPPIGFRFHVLGALFVVSALLVLARIAWVQSQLQERYLAALNSTTTEYELIPARDGRILTEAAEVLAADVEQYAIQVHYRWLQEPMDEAWLRRRIRRELTRTERRSDQLVQDVETELRQLRERMWADLSHITGMSVSDLTATRTTIQNRVTRISESVNQRHRESDNDVNAAPDGFLMQMAASVREALTTTPRRHLDDRIVIREEESFHEIAARVPFDVAAQIREQPNRYPGVRVVASNRRVYPRRSVAAHVVGARTPLREEEFVDVGPTVRPASWVPRQGRFGIERSYNGLLSGQAGMRKTVRNRRMQVIESTITQQPVSGQDVVLTINLSLQQEAERLLERALTTTSGSDANSEDVTRPALPRGGCIIVMDAFQGRLTAAASAPAFSLTLYTGGSAEQWEAANADDRHPFLSRITQMTLPCGSVMKAVTATAGLESQSIDPQKPFDCRGYLHRPDQHRCLIFRHYGLGHGPVTLDQAIAQSCNVYFFAAAERMGFPVLREWTDRFGMGHPTGVDLPFEQRGHVPGSATSASQRFQREALGLSVGQSSLTVTPLQVARMMAAIANGGWLVTPHIAATTGIAHQTTDRNAQPREIRRQRIEGLTDTTLQQIRAGLSAVVQSPHGTGYQTVRLPDITIAGKTGTAETGSSTADHAWFAGYVPADQPRYVVVVVLEHGGSGSRAAGPVTRQLVRAMQQLNLISGS